MVRLTDRPDMTLDVYRGRKTTKQQQQLIKLTRFNLFTFLILSQITPRSFFYKFTGMLSTKELFTTKGPFLQNIREIGRVVLNNKSFECFYHI